MNGALPLDGVQVLELSGTFAGGLAGRFLQGYGAAVTRVDLGAAAPLTGDETRYLHHGKLAGPDPHVAPGALRTAVDGADLILSDLQPRQLAALGLDWTAQHAAHPQQVIVSVTPFGLTGPYADFRHTNAVAFALGGIMGLTGHPERSPLVTGGNQAYALAGLNEFGAAVTNWLGRARHGRGDVVDISGQECAAGMLEYYCAATSYEGQRLVRFGNQTRASWGIYPCLDGWAGVFALARQIPALFALMDDPELDDPRFTDPLPRAEPENEAELMVKLYLWFSDKTKEQLRAIGKASRVPIGTATTPAELLHDAGLAERAFFDAVTDDDGPVTLPGRPFPGFSWRSESPAAGTGAQRADDQHADDDAPSLPLKGVKVLDLTMMWAGPFATLRMAEMGADVIKIESPSAWDNIRTLIPQPDVADPWNSAFYFNAYNRDKRSLTLDLAQEAGRALLLRLCADADVLIENYRADVLDKLGLSLDVLMEANPRLVVVSMAAFGKEGPDRDLVGFGPVIELMSGLATLSGYGDGEPYKTGISYGDPIAGTAAVAATALALLERDANGYGKGVHLDLAQRETAMVLIGEAFVAAGRGEEPVHRGCRDARFAPQGCYQVAGDDQWLVLSVRDDAEWAALLDVIGRPAGDPLPAYDVARRHADHDAIDSLIAAWAGGVGPQEAMEQLQSRLVPAGRVLDTASVLDDPHLVARRFWVELPHPKMHPYRQQGPVWWLADAKPWPRRHSPLFGEHNAEILQGKLGLSDAEMDELRAAAVIADAPINPGVG